MLLRTAIGWHFLNEGMEKIAPTDGKPFSAEAYLRNSAGPLAPKFRSLIPDVDGLERLSRGSDGRPEILKEQWREQLDRFAAHYHLADGERAIAEKELTQASDRADAWFLHQDNAEKVLKYADDVAKVALLEKRGEALESQRLLAQKRRKEVEATRKELVGVVDGWTDSLHKAWLDPKSGIVTPEQLKKYGPVVNPLTEVDKVNLYTKYGLALAGGCLLLGLFTPLAAVVGAGFLLLFYFAYPPWPGVPAPPNSESTHYWIVNKNLVEALACLVIATTPNSLWIGLDALLFGWLRRPDRHEADSSPARLRPVPGTEPPGSNPVPLPTTPPHTPSETRIPVGTTSTRSDRR